MEVVAFMHKSGFSDYVTARGEHGFQKIYPVEVLPHILVLPVKGNTIDQLSTPVRCRYYEASTGLLLEREFKTLLDFIEMYDMQLRNVSYASSKDTVHTLRKQFRVVDSDM